MYWEKDSVRQTRSTRSIQQFLESFGKHRRMDATRYLVLRAETDAISKFAKTENRPSVASAERQIPQYSSGLALEPRPCVNRHSWGSADVQELCLWICFLLEGLR